MKFNFDFQKCIPLTNSAYKKSYQRDPSFGAFLPFVEFEPKSRTFLFDDNMSVGMCFELYPVDMEAKPEERFEELQDALTRSLDSIPEFRNGTAPWVMQFYLQDEPIQTLSEDIFNYIKPEIRETKYSKFYLDILDKHYKAVCNEDGLFVDERSGINWKGKIRRVRAVLYRKVTRNEIKKGYNVIKEIHETAERFLGALKSSGIDIKIMNGKDFYNWMIPWLSPTIKGFDNPYDYLKSRPYPEKEEAEGTLPAGFDLGQSILKTPPSSENTQKKEYWRFGKKYSHYITFEQLTGKPENGCITTERKRGKKIVSLFDQLPKDSIYTITVIFKYQRNITDHIAKIKEACKGDDHDSNFTREQCSDSLELMADNNKMYPLLSGLFIRGDSPSDLEDNVKKSFNVINAAADTGLNPMDPEYDFFATDSFVKALPFCFDPELDEKTQRSKLNWSRDIASLLPLYGGAKASNNPGIVNFNRIGEPVMFDPLNKADREMTAHLMMFGPTGAGKSVALNAILMHIMAIHRPYLVIIEAGGSFELMGEMFARYGLTVNYVKITKKNPHSLPPFASALKILKNINKIDEEAEEVEEEDEDNEDRNYLNEMVVAAKLMITGGEPEEIKRFTRSNLLSVKKAIINAAQKAQKEKKSSVLSEDVVLALRDVANDKENSPRKKERIIDMADAMEVFCDGFAGKIFNTPGEAWKDTDVTIVDMGELAGEGYADALALAYIGLMQVILSRIEERQFGDRQTIIVSDEDHLFSSNSLLAPFMTKASKMLRKWGGWLWSATQNIEDYPDEARKRLNMAETWILLNMPPDEIKKIGRFKDLTSEQVSMLKSATKQSGQYSEGVVISLKYQTLLRFVLPKLPMILAQTDQDEKAAQMKYMNEHNLSSRIEAAFAMSGVEF